jgi:hypothetical protein
LYTTIFLNTVIIIIEEAIHIGIKIGTGIAARIGITNRMKRVEATIMEGKLDSIMIRDHTWVEVLTIWAHLIIQLIRIKGLFRITSISKEDTIIIINKKGKALRWFTFKKSSNKFINQGK